MKYLVCVKQVPDTQTRFQLEDGGRGVDLSQVKWIMNPYDEFALEGALRLKEASAKEDKGGFIQLLSIGPARVKEVLRTGLAMGADSACHIETEKNLDSLALARVIYSFMKDQNFDLVFCGSHSIDASSFAAGPMLAELWGRPSVFPVREVRKKANLFEIHRPLESGELEILSIKGPLVLSITKGVYEARCPNLPAIMRAKSKPLEEKTLSLDVESFIELEKLEFPPKPPPVQMIEGSAKEQARTLVNLLKNKEKVI